jgi:radical SAM-linked protein
MRTFQRAIRRADIPISYSAGFNPHQEISFGAPLALGVTSDAEYVDIKLKESLGIEEVKARLNQQLPQGIKILGGIILGERAKNAMALVTHARYTIRVLIEDISFERLNEETIKFANQDQILVMKEQPKKNFALKEIDIKPMIVDMKLMCGSEGEYFFNCMLLSGSKSNLKPELLVEAFKNLTEFSHLHGMKINREALYTEIDGKLVELLEASSLYGV